MCKCANVLMCRCVVNVQMVALICCALLLANAFRCKCSVIQRRQFAHLHILTLMLVHNHLKATIQVARDAVGTDGAHFRYVEALTTT